MSVITNCQPDYPILKKYKLSYIHPTLSDENDELELYIFPEDFKSTYEPKYYKLNSYGIYPYLNLRTHNVTVRYGSRFILNKLETLALKSLNTGIPLKFGTASDYAARPESLLPPPISHITNQELNEFTEMSQVLERDKELTTEVIDYENDLEENLKLYSGFIELPLSTSGIIGKGDIIDGFSFRLMQVRDNFRTVKIGDLTLKIPPESYSYQEVGTSGYIQESINNSKIINVGFVQKGFTINLPSAYTDTLETLKYYKAKSLLFGGINIEDSVGNSFNGLGYVNSLSYQGSILKKEEDSNPNNFLPNGLSFSVLSMDSFLTS